MNRPLLIINFQGVLGDFIKVPAFKMKESFKDMVRKTIREAKEERELEMEL